MAARGLISHLDLNVAEPEASIAFYDLVFGHLGYERHDISPGREWWQLDDGNGVVLGIEIRPPAQPAPRTRHERYSAGVTVQDPPAEYDYSPGSYAVAFDDPSGIRLEVVHDPTTNRGPE